MIFICKKKKLKLNFFLTIFKYEFVAMSIEKFSISFYYKILVKFQNLMNYYNILKISKIFNFPNFTFFQIISNLFFFFVLFTHFNQISIQWIEAEMINWWLAVCLKIHYLLLWSGWEIFIKIWNFNLVIFFSKLNNRFCMQTKPEWEIR